MSQPVDNIVKDASRTIARLDEFAAAQPGDVLTIDGTNWTGEDLRISVAEQLAEVIRHTVRIHKVTRRDAALMMAAHGASQFTIEQHARAIAAKIRSDSARHSWSARL